MLSNSERRANDRRKPSSQPLRDVMNSVRVRSPRACSCRHFGPDYVVPPGSHKRKLPLDLFFCWGDTKSNAFQGMLALQLPKERFKERDGLDFDVGTIVHFLDRTTARARRVVRVLRRRKRRRCGHLPANDRCRDVDRALHDVRYVPLSAASTMARIFRALGRLLSDRAFDHVPVSSIGNCPNNRS